MKTERNKGGDAFRFGHAIGLPAVMRNMSCDGGYTPAETVVLFCGVDGGSVGSGQASEGYTKPCSPFISLA